MQSKDLENAKTYLLQGKIVQHNCKTMETCISGDAPANYSLAFR